MKYYLFVFIVALILLSMAASAQPVATGGTTTVDKTLSVPFAATSQKRFDDIAVQIAHLQDSVWIKDQIAKLQNLRESILLTAVEAKGHDPNKVQLVAIKPGEILLKEVEKK